jgi:predicted Zn-dependent protease
VRGLAIFVTHGGKTYQMLGLGTPAGFAALEPAISAAASSFAPLNDPAALAVQPARIKLISVPGAMTVAELAGKYPALPADRLAILNQMETSTRLQAGQKVKIVEGKVREQSGG